MSNRTWVDVDINLIAKDNGDIKEYTYIDAIYQSLTNIFETMQGNRRMLPTFARNLYNLLFEPIDDDTSEIIGESILAGVEKWEPRIRVTNINVNPKHDYNQYNITLSFIILNEEDINTFNYILKAY